MLKYFLFGTGSLFAMLLNLFTGDGVTVKHNFPSSAAAGTEFTTEITISKTSVNPFGKLIVDMPEGFTVKEEDSRSGKFTFENRQLKIIWVQFPAENEFTVKIKVSIDNAVSGTKTIAGKFLCASGNERITIDIPAHEINVTNSQGVTATNNSGDSTKLNTPAEPGAEVYAERTITKDAATGNFKVMIKIRKGNIKGFAKYHDDLPEGVTATKDMASGAGMFKFVDKKASIIWATLPKDEVITASYWIKVNRTFTENPKINGAFSYIENEVTLKVNANESVLEVIPVENNQVANNQNQNKDSVKNAEANTNTVVVSNNNDQAQKKDSVKNIGGNTQDQNQDIKDNGLAASSVVYHVQIGAYKNPPATAYFASKFNIPDKINTDMHEGLTKFMIGKFTEYKETRDYRESVKAKGVTDAFVTAYNSGKRITVQEALMIARQKWFR